MPSSIYLKMQNSERLRLNSLVEFGLRSLSRFCNEFGSERLNMKLAFRTTISALCLCAVLPVFFASLGQTQSAQDQSNQTATKPATFFKDDFSVQIWGTGPSKYGQLWYQAGEYHMRATKGGFIVMYGPRDKEYLVENATVSVAARSVGANPPVCGYGIVVYGEKKKSQLEDYAFLIYSGPHPQYKIVLL